ncbi:MAG TPA: lamin tail domain-containing protein, partial [Candidatus Eisenbacteria bacterium]|nr:lamin tail domain-containing protein [Candidatus Eisenbacteria bacterium]
RYFKGTQAPSSPVTAWRNPTFNDATWLSGLTGIGYGDGDDRTQLGDMEDNYRTIFCRKFFTVPDVSAVEDLVLGIRYDDGFTAYLNGSEVASRNVSGDAFDDDALTAIEPTSEDIDISSFKNLLVNGTNLLAVQVHNAGIGSSDLSFDPKLVSRKTIPPSSSSHAPIVINEGFFRTASAASRFIELHNAGTDDIELGGYYLTDQFSALEKFRIPDGASIPAGGFVRFTQAELGFDLSIVPVTKERVSVALVDPAGTHVIDAFIFEPPIEGKSEARYPDGAARFSPAATPTPSAPNEPFSGAAVVINEIFYHPPSEDAADEFVELYNAGAAAVDMSGWSLRGVDLVLPDPTVLASGAYLVLARDPARIRSRYG